MALPKLSVPTFELTLPLSKKQVKFRPFLVKEQKILMMANEASDRETIIRAIHDILNNCCLSEIKIETLPLLDVEYFFINLRARSVGEVVDLKYRCQNTVNEEVCNNSIDVSVNLLEIEMTNLENYKDVIMINDKIGIKFKYPDFSFMNIVTEGIDQTEMATEIVINSIDYIFEGDTIYHAKESTKEEMLEFLDSLSQAQFDMVQGYFNNLPNLKKKVAVKCKKCGYDHNIEVEGVENFFE